MVREHEKIRLSKEEICEIIQLSAQNGVRLLSIGEFHVEFGTTAPQRQAGPHSSSTETVLSAKEHETQTQEQIEAEEIRIKEERIANALVDDPALAERLLIDEELEDDDGEFDGNE